MEIIKNKLYKPRQIAELALILNNKGNKDYNHILELIKTGRLMAVNRGMRSVPHYAVPGYEIIRYKKEVEGLLINNEHQEKKPKSNV